MVVDKVDLHLLLHKSNAFLALTMCRKGRREIYPPAFFLCGWHSFRHQCGYNEEQ
jgi:hypothetical protein